MAVFCAICSTCNAADIIAAADTACVIAVFYSAAAISCDTADIIAAADTACVIAVFYTADAISCDTADIIAALNPAFFYAKVFYCATDAYITKETLIIFASVI